MTSDDRTLLIYTTFPSEADARRVGEHLVKTRLAGCVNIFSGMKAIFEWEGKLETAPETAMLIKTRGARRDDVIAKVQEMHPYSVPAILTLRPEQVAASYEDWLLSQTAG